MENIITDGNELREWPSVLFRFAQLVDGGGCLASRTTCTARPTTPPGAHVGPTIREQQPESRGDAACTAAEVSCV